MPFDLAGMRPHDCQARLARPPKVARAPIAGQLRVEHVTEPVNDDRLPDLGQDTVIHPRIIIRPLGACRQGPAGHQDDLAAQALDKTHLLLIGGDHLAEREIRARGEMIGAGARSDSTARGRGLNDRAPDEFLRRRPVETHAALRGIHGLGHGEPV
jgi:hypothetical protein